MSLASLEQALPEGRPILLDTTAVIAYFKGNEAASPVATYVIDELVHSGRNEAIVSAVTALELLVDPIRSSNDELYRSVLFFLVHTRHLRVVQTRFEEAHEAAVLRARYAFKSPDALIIATGYRAAVACIVCNDEEWKRKLPTAPGKPAVCYLEDHLPFP